MAGDGIESGHFPFVSYYWAGSGMSARMLYRKSGRSYEVKGCKYLVSNVHFHYS